jgi:hypothetical protein
VLAPVLCAERVLVGEDIERTLLDLQHVFDLDHAVQKSGIM